MNTGRTHFQKGMTPWNKGKKLGFTPKCAFTKGQVPWNKGKEYLAIKGSNHPYFKNMPRATIEAARKKNKTLVGERSHLWKGGISYEPYSSKFNKQIKDRVRVRDNFICQECGVPELECNEKLSAHHVDYDKKNTSLINLISLCRKCHAKTNFNREYWIKKFSDKNIAESQAVGKE